MSGVTTQAYFWCLQREDGVGFATTSHDRAIEKESITFEPAPTFVPENLVQSENPDEWSLSFEGHLSSGGLRSDDLRAGRWSGAGFRLSAGAWEDGSEPVLISLGEIGAIRFGAEQFEADLETLPAVLQSQPCPQTSPECRAQLGDRRCRVDLRSRRRRSKVRSSAGREVCIDLAATENFAFGRLRWVTGRNSGIEQTVAAVRPNIVELRDLPSEPIQPDDEIVLTEGCDGRLQTCAERFGNVVNFRGEPHLPGTDYIVRYPGA